MIGIAYNIVNIFFDETTSENQKFTVEREGHLAKHPRKPLKPRKIEKTKSQTRSFIKIRVFWFILSFAFSDQKKSKTSAKQFQEEKI